MRWPKWRAGITDAGTMNKAELGNVWPCLARRGRAWLGLAMLGHAWPCLAMLGKVMPGLARAPMAHGWGDGSTRRRGGARLGEAGLGSARRGVGANGANRGTARRSAPCSKFVPDLFRNGEASGNTQVFYPQWLEAFVPAFHEK